MTVTRVAVIGGAGYVGRELCAELKRRDHEVVAVARANGKFLLHRVGVRSVLPEEAVVAGPFEVVVNLAYPARVPGYSIPEENRAILELILRLAGRKGRVIHTSTLGVFGFGLDHPIEPAPVRRRRDFPYVESKIEMENTLARAVPGGRLRIVRLGNVWGPASPTWTAALADRLLWGEPVGVVGGDGYCNATDVANTASYLAFQVEHPDSAIGVYHHLAELSDTPWSDWVRRIAGAMGIQPVLSLRGGHYSRSLSSELRGAATRHGPLAVAREMNAERFAGSWVRRVVRVTPPRLFQWMRRRSASRRTAWGPDVPRGDVVLLEVVSARKRFANHVDEAWHPPLDVEASWRAVEAWMARAGYVNGATR